MKKNFFFISVFFISIAANSQCAMCKAVIEGAENQETAEAVNDGITYLMVFPYILVGILAYFIIRYRKKQQES